MIDLNTTLDPEPEKSKPSVQLSGADGNIFNLMGLCARALRKAGQEEEAKQLSKEVMTADSYDSALQVLMKYCDVQ